MYCELPCVIRMVEENCTNCHQCIAVCPVKYCNDGSGDTVKINKDMCIGCGRCVQACIQSHNGDEERAARHYVDDMDKMLRDLGKGEMAALIAPSAQSNFDLPRLITALRKLGFVAVYDVSFGAEITVACYHRLVKEGKIKPPIIAQHCPAIVKYIEINQPTLIPHLANVGSPLYNTAVYVKSQHPGYRLAFISPCLAKGREIRESNLIDYNVTFKSIDCILKSWGICLDDMEPGDFDNDIPAGMAAKFSSPGGFKGTYLYWYPETPAWTITRVEGKTVYEKYLPDLEKAIKNRSPHLPMIVDILNCEKGCNMGPGCINHDLSFDEIEKAVVMRAEENNSPPRREKLSHFLSRIDFEQYRYDNYCDLSENQNIRIPNEQELEKIYSEMLKTEDKDFRNCGACGYNSCYRMAVAIYNGLNKAQNCHLYREKALHNDQERFQAIAREISHAFTSLPSSVAELSTNTSITLNNINEVIANIDTFRNFSIEMEDEAENLAPLVHTISSFARTLQEHLYFLQQMIDAIPTPIFFRDPHGVFQGCNKAFEDVLGRKKNEIVGQHLNTLLPDGSEMRYRELGNEKDNANGHRYRYYELEFTFADGTTHNMIFSQAPFFNMAGRLLGVVGVMVDITERKRMEQEVLRLDRLRVVGEMAAGIAHEIRNPMTTVRGFLQMLKDIPELSNYKDYFNMMMEELDNANSIIAEFLSLAKDKTVDLKQININTIIDALMPILNAEAIKSDKSVKVELDDEVPELCLDARQIRQLILNLARNGLEAMQPGGTLTIATYTEGEEVVLMVKDQGPGIDPYILSRLGTPFCTTKEQGTGLGLAICYSIASRHNAKIEVETGNQGTSFFIHFPTKTNDVCVKQKNAYDISTRFEDVTNDLVFEVDNRYNAQ